MGKTKTFEWGPEQQHAFDTLKQKLMAYPILRRPDFDRPFAPGDFGRDGAFCDGLHRLFSYAA
jgi:hypothetical protein